jgi:NADH dehydrogenase/NADH:ubiquinone oxidoreductase subunit G
MEKLVSLTIDGKRIEAAEGTLVIEAAETVGIHIPRLCYMKELDNVGSCRICLVEIEGRKGLQPACRIKVKDGLVISTNTEAVIEARKFVLQLLLSTHPTECVYCKKAGRCELYRYVQELGIRKTIFPKKYFDYEIKREPFKDAFIEWDPNLCILCGRCVRACKKWGTSILEFMERGLGTTVSTPKGVSLKEAGCNFCGACLRVCPVGAMVEAEVQDLQSMSGNS